MQYNFTQECRFLFPLKLYEVSDCIIVVYSLHVTRGMEEAMPEILGEDTASFSPCLCLCKKRGHIKRCDRGEKNHIGGLPQTFISDHNKRY